LLLLDEALKPYLPEATSAAPAPAAKPPFMLQIVSPKLHAFCPRCRCTVETDQDVRSPDHQRKYEPPLPLMLPAPVDVEDDDDGN
jgi:hypothetical protein